MSQQLPNVETAIQLGLTADEFELVKKHMGRQPNFTELSIFSVMWSEHCSYKNSIKYLKTLPRKGEKLLVEAGEENAGLVDIGGGMACAFKIESHNHPSFIEPFQGAATGVGGIHRDIFTMGARPIAALNSLRFGKLNTSKMRRLVAGVVDGISSYGNCFGVPTVAGETYFHPSYDQNILVNAMSVGIVEVGKTLSATADGPGNSVFIVGSATGKDGIHGATFASADLTEESSEDLPSVQVGDPFQEKLLLEASLELAKTDAIIGMQDMGAAGIICSTSEMSAKSKTGMKIDLDKVPTRQANMKDWEILLSESQERMLVVVKKGREQEVLDIFDKWDLECKEIGEITDTQHLEFYQNGELCAHVPCEPLVLGGGAPVYDREYERPTYLDKIDKFDASKVDEPNNLMHVAKKLLESPNIASKKWISEQYDSMVRLNNANTNMPSDAAIIRLKDSSKALLATTDCNSNYVYADPEKGAMIAVSEAARNIVCSGGEPVAITNCLNFGNPYSPEVYYQFVNAIKGMGAACEKFETPVTGGNVSFYNQSNIDGNTVPVQPTPTIGMLGIMEDVENRMGLAFQNEGDVIVLLGPINNCINSSEYLRIIHKENYSPAPYFDLEMEYQVQRCISKLITEKLPTSVHDVSDGGLFFNLLESGMVNKLGFELNVFPKRIRKDAFLFGEGQSRVVISLSKEKLETLQNIAETFGVDSLVIGEVKERNIVINKKDFGAVNKWKYSFDHRLGELLGE